MALNALLIARPKHMNATNPTAQPRNSSISILLILPVLHVPMDLLVTVERRNDHLVARWAAHGLLQFVNHLPDGFHMLCRRLGEVAIEVGKERFTPVSQGRCHAVSRTLGISRAGTALPGAP